jgi:16S rRNA (cytosine1402-N4)-methyltransferase
MLEECISGLNIKPDGIYVDGTLGGAGHSSYIVQKLNENGLLIGIDRDQEALNSAKQKLINYNNVKYVHGNHDDILDILQDLGIDKVDGILLDLGISSYQIDNSERGFSYMQDNKLDMRMDQSQDLSAWDVINNYKEEDLANIIYKYGEEKFSRRIAKNICIKRQEKPINTTFELVDIIKESVPNNPKEGHPAKRTFQAIRIEVNGELKPLYDTISNSIKALKPQGRLCVITFHSLEDGIVKQAMQDLSGKCTCPPGLPYCVCGAKSFGRVITRKPIIPTEKEYNENSRSRSAKLRIFERN